MLNCFIFCIHQKIKFIFIFEHKKYLACVKKTKLVVFSILLNTRIFLSKINKTKETKTFS